MTTRFGVFGQTQAIGIGDPFVDSVKPDPRDHGLNFKSPTCKHGKNNDACFDKLKPLYEGEKYIDPLRLKLQALKAGAKRNVSDKPFKGPSPMKASACPGDYVGTLGGRMEHLPGTIELARKKGDIQLGLRNIVTGPSKKGSFGFIGTTLSERQGAKGVAGEYQYLADPIHEAVRIRDRERAAVTPFRPIGPPKRGGPGTVTRHFGGRTKGAVGEFAWCPRPEPPVRSRAPGAAGGGGDGGGGGGAAAAATAGPPFRPVPFPRTGRQATFAPLPPYEHDPEEPKAAARAAVRRAEREHLAAHAGGAWRPGGGVKTDATRSIVRANLR